MPRCRWQRRGPSPAAAGLPEPASPIVPVVIGEAGTALAASRMLEDEGFLVVAIRPPTVPDGTARLRLTFTARIPTPRSSASPKSSARVFLAATTCATQCMTAFFITATGTDIGKTFVAAGLIRHMQAAGRPVEALKPVVSGFDPGAWHGSDPGVLLAALGRPAELAEIERISPWRFTAPLSPDMAARREGRAIDFEALVEFCRRSMTQASGTLLIEGIGGIMVPLDDRHTVLDWMSALRIPWCWWRAAISAPSATR